MRFFSLGFQEYQKVLQRQLQLREERQAGRGEDTILIVEHPKVITQGRREADEDFLVPPHQLERQGYQIERIHRGGKLTYHGPGQLVAYFIISLRERRLKVPQFVRSIEEIVIQTCQAFQVSAQRREGCPGVWVEERKIASIGLSVDRGVSMHGVALNVAPELSDFQVIVPCGMVDCEVTSLQRESKQNPTLAEVETSFVQMARTIL